MLKSGSAEVDEQGVGDAGGAEGVVNSDGCSKELRADACAPFGFGFAESSLRFTSVHSRLRVLDLRRSASCVARPSHAPKAIPYAAPALNFSVLPEMKVMAYFAWLLRAKQRRSGSGAPLFLPLEFFQFPEI